MFTGLGRNLRWGQAQKMSWRNHSIVILGPWGAKSPQQTALALDQVGRDSSNSSNGFCRLAHAVLVRSDGSAVATGNNGYGQCDVPPLDERLTYTKISAGDAHTVLLRSDGTAVAIGCNEYGQCDIPPLDEGITYTQISAGYEHTVLLRSDGSAIAIGSNDYFFWMIMENVKSHLWTRNWYTPWFLQAVLLQCFCGMMAVLLPSENFRAFHCQSLEYAT